MGDFHRCNKSIQFPEKWHSSIDLLVEYSSFDDNNVLVGRE